MSYKHRRVDRQFLRQNLRDQCLGLPRTRRSDGNVGAVMMLMRVFNFRAMLKPMRRRLGNFFEKVRVQRRRMIVVVRIVHFHMDMEERTQQKSEQHRHDTQENLCRTHMQAGL